MVKINNEIKYTNSYSSAEMYELLETFENFNFLDPKKYKFNYSKNI